uniref:Uncharacterized protein n=1 Tax=Oryza glumipatula TaxID=40148 RepID=A0A0E0ASJ3_9ORYZ
MPLHTKHYELQQIWCKVGRVTIRAIPGATTSLRPPATLSALTILSIIWIVTQGYHLKCKLQVERAMVTDHKRDFIQGCITFCSNMKLLYSATTCSFKDFSLNVDDTD